MLEELQGRNQNSIYKFINFGIEVPREILYERINNRVHQMMIDGLLAEAKKVYELKLEKSCTCMQAIGYKEFFEFFEGKNTLDESIERLQQETRRYAKRQMTWFKKISDVIWLDGLKSTNEQIDEILGELKWKQKKAK
jgi:tRNA dimethylallyltransferase